MVTTGRLGDICRVGGNRLVGSSTVGSTVDSTVDGRLGMGGRGSIVVRVDFGCPSWL